MTAKLFAESITLMEATFGKKLEPAVKDVYWRMLRGYSDEAWSMAVERVLGTFRPTTANQFPPIADFREACSEGSRRDAVRVVQMLKRASNNPGYYASVDFGNPALHSVIERLGGWIAICNWSYRDWELQESRVIESYVAAVERGDVGPRYLVGMYERDNALSGHHHKSERIEFRPTLASSAPQPGLEYKPETVRGLIAATPQTDQISIHAKACPLKSPQGAGEGVFVGEEQNAGQERCF